MFDISRRLVSLAMVVALALAPVAVRAQEKIRIGILPFSESLPAVIADKQGFFKEEGLDVDMVKFDSGAIAIPVLLSGRLDIVQSNTVSTLQAIEQGLDATLLVSGTVARKTAPDTTSSFVVRKGEIKSLKELEGKRVAVNVIKSSAWLLAVAALDAQGVDYSKVRFAEVPFPQMNDPFLSGQLDAIVQVEPWREILAQTGKVEVLSFPYVELTPGAPLTQYIAMAPWAEKNRDIAARFVRAILKGANFAASNEAVTREINVEFTNLIPELKDKVQLPLFGAEVDVERLRSTMDMMQKYGLLKGPVDLSKRVFKP
jgi:NitT/TauT family transport system substrate-binding protein